MPSLRARLTRRLIRFFTRSLVPGTPVAKIRAGMEMNAKYGRLPKGTRTEDVSAGGVAAQWVIPPEGGDGVLLYLHGGSFVAGSIASHRSFALQLARAAGMRALAVGYRLAPEHAFPASIEDCVAAYRWLAASGERRIVLAGDSAGGTLALATLLALRDAGDALPAAAVCLSPVTDLTCSGGTVESNAHLEAMVRPAFLRYVVDLYLGGADARQASPLFGELRGLPPLLLQVGGHEVLRSDSERFAERARAAGVDATLEVWPGMFHAWQQMGSMLPEAKRAVAAVGAFARARLA